MNKALKNYFKKYLPSPLRYLYWLVKVLRVKVILWIPRYNEDTIITAHYPYFLEDEKFQRAYESAKHLELSKPWRWRLHTLCWAASKCESLGGGVRGMRNS